MIFCSFRYWEPFGIFSLLNDWQLAGTKRVKIIVDVFKVLLTVTTALEISLIKISLL